MPPKSAIKRSVTKTCLSLDGILGYIVAKQNSHKSNARGLER